MQKNIYVIDHTFYDPEDASNSPKADSWKRATDGWDGASTVEASASKKKKKVGTFHIEVFFKDMYSKS